ncbi:hypothetical protein [Spongorhabdus nitratireducens]
MITATKTLHPNALFAANKTTPKKPSALKRFGLRLVAILKGTGNGFVKGQRTHWTLVAGRTSTTDLIRNFKSRPAINSLKLARKGLAVVPQVLTGAYIGSAAGMIYGGTKAAVTGKVCSVFSPFEKTS